MTENGPRTQRATPLFISLSNISFAFRLVIFIIVNRFAPQPYIDETFHVPQAQAYCKGRFLEWNDKITTPPGLYLVSYLINRIGQVLILPVDLCSVTALRALNLFLVCFILPLIMRRLYRLIHEKASEDAIALAGLLPAFPLLSFFGNLYYTDVLSTTTVLYCYLLAVEKRYILSSLVGGLSVFTRQTNVIWVAFILAVSVIRRLKEVDIVDNYEPGETKGRRSWMMFDPLAAEAKFPVDYLVAIRQCILAAVANFSIVLFILLSYSPVLVGFALFLLWNQGIVLGDKSHHIAGINFPQLFYCAFFIAFFGTPIFLSLRLAFRFIRSSLSTARRLFTFLSIISVMLVIVHYNTVEHPFLRADNRHFVFYIWRRTIKRHYLAKYIAVPIYYTSTWLVVRTLAYSQSALFVLGMVTCTALTIVPSPLLEFRYFVLPYLLWRLHLSPLTLRDKWRGVMEYIWFEVINVVTLWLFVTRPFEWPSEPGKVQRFIW